MLKSIRLWQVAEGSLKRIAQNSAPKGAAYFRPDGTSRYYGALHRRATIIALFESAAERLPAPIQSAHESHLLSAMRPVLLGEYRAALSDDHPVRLRSLLPDSIANLAL